MTSKSEIFSITKQLTMQLLAEIDGFFDAVENNDPETATTLISAAIQKEEEAIAGKRKELDRLHVHLTQLNAIRTLAVYACDDMRGHEGTTDPRPYAWKRLQEGCREARAEQAKKLSCLDALSPELVAQAKFETAMAAVREEQEITKLRRENAELAAQLKKWTDIFGGVEPKTVSLVRGSLAGILQQSDEEVAQLTKEVKAWQDTFPGLTPKTADEVWAKMEALVAESKASGQKAEERVRELEKELADWKDAASTRLQTGKMWAGSTPAALQARILSLHVEIENSRYRGDKLQDELERFEQAVRIVSPVDTSPRALTQCLRSLETRLSIAESKNKQKTEERVHELEKELAAWKDAAGTRPKADEAWSVETPAALQTRIRFLCTAVENGKYRVEKLQDELNSWKNISSNAYVGNPSLPAETFRSPKAVEERLQMLWDMYRSEQKSSAAWQCRMASVTNSEELDPDRLLATVAAWLDGMQRHYDDDSLESRVYAMTRSAVAAFRRLPWRTPQAKPYTVADDTPYDTDEE